MAAGIIILFSFLGVVVGVVAFSAFDFSLWSAFVLYLELAIFAPMATLSILYIGRSFQSASPPETANA